MRRGICEHDMSSVLCVDVFAEWLEWTLGGEQLAAEVEKLFRDHDLVMPRPMRADLARFLADRSAKTLARCLAMNEEPARRREFVEWCREVIAEEAAPYARLGLKRSDYCAERGPGHNEQA